MTKLFTSPFNHVQYALIKSSKELDKFCVKHNVAPSKFMSLGKQAQCTIFERDGTRLVLVQLDKKEITKLYTPTQIVGLIVHESVHVWQEVRSAMGEDNPSSEFEAYSVERIVEDLLSEWE